MKIEDLKDRIVKKETQIVKIEKRIAKWEKAKSVEDFIKSNAWLVSREPKSIKTLDDMIVARAEYDPEGNAKEWVYRNLDNHMEMCDKEIKYANRDLEDAKVQLNKYNNALALLDEKARTPKIQVIVDFLENWKKDAKEYVYDNVKYLIKYYEVNHEACDFWNHNRNMPRDEFKKRYDEYNKEEKRLKSMVHPWTDMCYERNTETHINEEKLNELVNAEAENKYWELIDRVTEKAGDIIDVSALRIGGKGDLNGYAIGSKNKVHVETIIAGGYNAGIIVNVKRGPIAHYRTIVNVVK